LAAAAKRLPAAAAAARRLAPPPPRQSREKPYRMPKIIAKYENFGTKNVIKFLAESIKFYDFFRRSI
jgi:hypothetical protein